MSVASGEQYLTSLNARLYGMLRLVCCGWHEDQCTWLKVSVGFEQSSVWREFPRSVTMTSRNGM